MAFVPDAELFNFVDNLDVEVESENLREEKSLSDTGCRDEKKKMMCGTLLLTLQMIGHVA